MVSCADLRAEPSQWTVHCDDQVLPTRGAAAAGHRTSANQADYGEDHLRRLRLITILLEVGGLSITSIKLVVDAIDDESHTVHEVLGAAHHALALRGATPAALPEHDEAETEIDEYVRTLGWNVTADAPGRRELAAVLVSLRRMGWRVDAGVFDEYARAADQIAQWESPTPPTTPTGQRSSRRWSSARWRSRRHWLPCVAWPRSTTRPPGTSIGDELHRRRYDERRTGAEREVCQKRRRASGVERIHEHQGADVSDRSGEWRARPEAGTTAEQQRSIDDAHRRRAHHGLRRLHLAEHGEHVVIARTTTLELLVVFVEHDARRVPAPPAPSEGRSRCRPPGIECCHRPWRDRAAARPPRCGRTRRSRAPPPRGTRRMRGCAMRSQRWSRSGIRP